MRQVILEDDSKPRAVLEEVAEPRGMDLQDWLLAGGIVLIEAAAAVIWWPAALLLGGLLCFGFAYLIERSKRKRGNPKP